jgi:hypothetical protein
MGEYNEEIDIVKSDSLWPEMLARSAASIVIVIGVIVLLSWSFYYLLPPE